MIPYFHPQKESSKVVPKSELQFLRSIKKEEEKKVSGLLKMQKYLKTGINLKKMAGSLIN